MYSLSAPAFTRPHAIYRLVRHNHANRPSCLSRRPVRLHFPRTRPPPPRRIAHLGYPCLTLPNLRGDPPFLVNCHLPAQPRGPPLSQTPGTGFIVPAPHTSRWFFVPAGPLWRDALRTTMRTIPHRVKTFFYFFFRYHPPHRTLATEAYVTVATYGTAPSHTPLALTVATSPLTPFVLSARLLSPQSTRHPRHTRHVAAAAIFFATSLTLVSPPVSPWRRVV